MRLPGEHEPVETFAASRATSREAAGPGPRGPPASSLDVIGAIHDASGGTNRTTGTARSTISGAVQPRRLERGRPRFLD
ncbi:hypothetical protein [Saccharopolyspora spinosa]|uniref:Uncharacterized protein n=1 Tax=Saccharopolyspora spinosa TaxID=60894 RepID=A0A2N3Y4S6_SACSN|nr:hypothetical protein [Saccharopolyspora spinosa]PKW17910.1 hypothetical protein A8926_5938 [Saccharopolyspora spinosa]